MAISDWTEQDYQKARQFLGEHEDLTSQGAVLNVGDDLHIVLPKGLPALGARFHGLFMLAPLPLLMLSVVLLPIFGFSTSWSLSGVSMGITAGCAVMLAGLVRVLWLTLQNRDLFPRKYFVTIGRQGVAMHFSRFHFPWSDPRTAIRWTDLVGYEPAGAIFWPALAIGRLKAPGWKLQARNGDVLHIPLNPKPGILPREMDRIQKLIDRGKRGTVTRNVSNPPPDIPELSQ